MAILLKASNMPSRVLLQNGPQGPKGPLWGCEQLGSRLGKPFSQLLLPSEAPGAPGSPRGERRKPVGNLSPSFSHRALQNPTNELALQTLIHFCERRAFDSMSSNERASMSISLHEKTQENLQNFHKTRG